MGDSSAWRRLHSRIRASAGTRSPASSKITSPGTSWAAGIFVTFPPRRTAAWGEDNFRSSSRACWARSSWEMEMIPFTTTMTRMMTASSQSSPPLAARDTPAAPSSTRIIGSFSCPRIRPSSPSCLGGLQLIGAVPPQALLRLMGGEPPGVWRPAPGEAGPPSHCASGSCHHAPSVFFHYTEGPVRILGKTGRANSPYRKKNRPPAVWRPVPQFVKKRC